MNYISTLLTIGAVFVLAVAGYAGYYTLNKRSSEEIMNMNSANLASTLFQPQINTEGSVSITIIPPAVLPESEVWVFGVTLDTHSVDLKEDVSAISFLVDDKGNIYKPISWQGDNPGGHHRKGILTFDPIIPKPAYIKLKVSDVGGIPERIFKWTF